MIKNKEEKAQKNKTTTAVLAGRSRPLCCVLRPMFKKLLHLAAKKNGIQEKISPETPIECLGELLVLHGGVGFLAGLPVDAL